MIVKYWALVHVQDYSGGEFDNPRDLQEQFSDEKAIAEASELVSKLNVEESEPKSVYTLRKVFKEIFPN